MILHFRVTIIEKANAFSKTAARDRLFKFLVSWLPSAPPGPNVDNAREHRMRAKVDRSPTTVDAAMSHDDIDVTGLPRSSCPYHNESAMYCHD